MLKLISIFPNLHPMQNKENPLKNFQDNKYRDGHVGFGSRILVMDPSDEMVWLEENVQANLFRLDEILLCYTTPQNMVGSLLVLRNLQKISELFAQFSLPVPEKFAKPVEIRTNVPIYVADLVHEESDPVLSDEGSQLFMGRVLIKHACGAQSAIVLDPPYAGLVLADYQNEGNFVVDKVWGDYSLIRPDDSVMKYYKHDFFSESIPQELSELILAHLLDDYLDLVHRFPMASDLFIHLFNTQFSEPIEMTSFHRTVGL